MLYIKTCVNKRTYINGSANEVRYVQNNKVFDLPFVTVFKIKTIKEIKANDKTTGLL